MQTKAFFHSVTLTLLLSSFAPQEAFCASDIKERQTVDLLPLGPLGRPLMTFQDLMKGAPHDHLTLEYACNHYNPVWILNDIRATSFEQPDMTKDKRLDLFYKWLFAQRLHVSLEGKALDTWSLKTKNRQNQDSSSYTTVLEALTQPVTTHQDTSSPQSKTTGKGKKSSAKKMAAASSSTPKISLSDYKEMHQYVSIKKPNSQINSLKPILDYFDVRQEFLKQLTAIDERIEQLAPQLLKLINSKPNELERFQARALLGMEGALSDCLRKNAIEIAAKGGLLPEMTNLSAILLKQGKYEEAEEWFRKVNVLTQEMDVNIIYNLSITLNKQGKREEAEKWLRKVVTASKETHVNAMYNLSITSHKQGKYEEAEKWSRKVVEISHEKNVKAMCNLGTALFEQRKYEEAAEWFRKVNVLTRETDVDVMHSLGIALFEQGKYVEAEKWSRKAVETSHETDVKAMCNLGAALSEQGKYEEAEEWSRKAVEISRETDVKAMCNLGAALFEQGKYEEAEKWSRKAVEISHETDVDVLHNLGVTLYKQNKNGEAKFYFEKTLKGKREDSNLYLALISEGDEAEDYFQEAIRCGVENAEILYLNFLLQQGRLEQAIYIYFYEEDFSSEEEPIVEESLATTSSEAGLSATISATETKPTQSPQKTEEEPFIPTQREEKYRAPDLSKRMKKIEERAKEAENRLKSALISQKERRVSKTYRDIEVSMTSGVQTELDASLPYIKMKIQGLISMLVNGEYQRGQFEWLNGNYNPPLYSMRITEKDRLVFELPEGPKPEGITKIQIVSVKGHYDNMKQKTYIPVNWATP